ncbi:MAG TPA: DUF11 domain-containing protein, partial [Caldilineae bacterium]|nr:DUF11 domain-containing protein [Caldilineae bacterium]
MNRRVLFFMIAVAMGLLLAAFAAPRAAPASQALPQTQVILEPVAMAWVSSAEPDTNFGGRGYIWVGYGHGTGDTLSALRGLVKFDLSGIPSDAIITEARLYAAIIDAQGLPDHFVYYAGYALDQMTRWTEDGVTWNNHPNAAWGTAYLDISATFGQVSWDVTTIVQGMIDGRWVNNGFYLMRENDQTDPQEHARLFQNLALVVNYESPTPTPTPEPLVRIDKADLTDPVYAGDEVQYTISVRNLTDRPLLRMMLQDTIPDGATFVEASGSGSFDGDRTVTWLIRILPANASRTLQLTLRTSPDTPDGTELINRAVASYRCQGGDEGSQICFQEATETTTVRRQPTPTPISVMCLLDEAGDTFAMAAEFTPGPRGTQARICPPSDEDWYKFPVDEGDIIEGRLYDLPAEYYIELWRGDGSHVGTFVPDELADVEFSWRVEAGRGGWWRVRVWSPSDAFSPYPYSLMIQVHAPTPTPTRTTTPTSTPTMTPTPTPTPTTRSRAELTINKRVDTSEPIRPDQDVEYVISVHNSGDAPARQVEIRDIIPPRTTFVSASPAATYANGVVTWPVRDRLNPGAQLNYRVTLHVAADVPDGFVLTNRAEARAEDVPRVRDEASITVSGLPQLHVSKHPMSVPARGGEDLTYEIVVSNEGEAPAYNVVVWDEDLPAEFVSAGPNGVYDRSERTLTWPTIPVLNPGESRTYHVTVHIADDVSHNVIITNYAYAEADNADRAMARSSMNTWNPPDLIADGLEVTQGIQDLNNSVVLIKGKRTYVRFYVHSDGDPIS